MTDATTPPNPDDHVGAVIGLRTVVVVVLFLALEFALRQSGYGMWTVQERSERFGWTMLPSQAAWSRDLTVPESINAYGFRDRDWNPPRRDPSGTPVADPSVFRLAFVGNSMTYGTSVDVDEGYPRVVEKLLSEEFARRGDPRRVECMNFAVQGYVFEQMARVYEDVIADWRPDLLVVPVHPHDITPMKPASDDADYDFREQILRTATHDLLQQEVIDKWIPPVPNPETLAVARDYQRIDDAVTFAPFSKDMNTYWEAYLQRLDQVAADLAAHGGKLVVVNLPRWRKLFQPSLREATSRLQPFANSRETVLLVDPVPDFVAPMQPVVAELQAQEWFEREPFETGAERVPHAPGLHHDMTQLLRFDPEGGVREATELQSADKTLFLLDDNGHYSALGHLVLGRSIATALRDGDWLE